MAKDFYSLLVHFSYMWKTHSHPFIRNHRPLIMAHRGDSANIPENTLPAFKDAAKLDVDCLETDVHLILLYHQRHHLLF